MDDITTDEEQNGLSRRTVLRRGAILGGAMAWTVPAVQSIAGPAFASGSPCVGRFEFTDEEGTCMFVQYQPDDSCCDCITSFVAQFGPEFIVLAGAVCQATGACVVQNAGTC